MAFNLKMENNSAILGWDVQTFRFLIDFFPAGCRVTPAFGTKDVCV